MLNAQSPRRRRSSRRCLENSQEIVTKRKLIHRNVGTRFRVKKRKLIHSNVEPGRYRSVQIECWSARSFTKYLPPSPGSARIPKNDLSSWTETVEILFGFSSLANLASLCVLAV